MRTYILILMKRVSTAESRSVQLSHYFVLTLYKATCLLLSWATPASIISSSSQNRDVSSWVGELKQT